MNNLRTLLIAAALAGTLAGCGADDTDGTTDPTATPTTASETSEATAAGETPITITAGEQRITATLNDSDAARDLQGLLPVTLPSSRNLGIEYIAELPGPLTETGPFYTTVEAGDLVYYNPEDTLTVIYAPTSSVPTLTKVGEITSDLDVFAGLPDDVELRIEAGA